MRESDVAVLNQLAKSLEEAELKLEEYYEKKDYEKFTKLKKFILQIQNKIGEISRNSKN
ncbi:MAG: hypothetical protein ABH804_00810 [archaeon]